MLAGNRSADHLIAGSRQCNHLPMPFSSSRPNSEILRRKAEKILRDKGQTRIRPSSLRSAMEEELRVHAMELEIQNEELQESRAQLEESQTRYFRHFDLAPVGMIRLSDGGIILEANMLGARMLAIERSRFHSSKVPFCAYVAHESQETFYAHLKSIRASKKMESCELCLRRASGDRTFVRMQSIVSGPADDTAELFVTLTDLTENQRFAEKMVEQKHIALTATMAKDVFLAMLSHELRTPLTPVLLLIEELGQNPVLSDQDRASLSLMRRNLELETLLIDELLDLTRIISGKIALDREITDARVTILDAVKICRHAIEAKQLELKLDLNAAHHIVNADCTRLQQIIWNLLQNAIKFTAKGGVISVRLFNGSPRRVSLEITDTGIGIEPKALLRIFDPFTQAEQSIRRNFGGLGLGLAISKSLAQAHGGSLTAFSAGLGEGSTFRLELPALDLIELPAPKRGPETSPSKGRTSLHLLLVEDHDDTRTTLLRMLAHHGYDVEGAANAVSAQALCSQKKFDLLISDIGLPDRSGLDLMIEMKERHELAGIAMSGFGMECDIAMSRAAGFSEHLIKPINIGQLEAAIERTVALNLRPAVV
jgi:signal transduction histidine kinase/ActR/RegA family two-component response regulator